VRETEVPVTFLPWGKTAYVLPGTRLLEAAVSAGIVIDQPCGGEGICGKCRVMVVRGACEPTSAEQKTLTPDELAAGWRLACQASICAAARVEVPGTSLLDARQQILVQCEKSGEPDLAPTVRKRYVELPEPRRGDDEPDLVRLQEAIGPFEIGLELLRQLPGRLRENQFRGTAVMADGHLIDFEPQDTVRQNYGVAVDLGTTTLAAVLIDLHTGDELAIASRQNPQTRFGDDVLSRIHHCGNTPDGLAELSETVVEAINAMIDELAADAKVPRERVYEATFSGNTTMEQLLCRIDPRPLGEVPFVPATGRGVMLPAAKLGLRMHPRAAAYVLPVIGGFVGGDTVAGILAAGMAEAAGPTLLVDIGTNGEIVLAADGKLWAASTAAGPAFEGARILHGMRGSAGAIEKVVVDGRLRINVIGDVPPVGLCGSGLIDLAAELLRHGVISSVGRIEMPEAGDNELGADLARRIVPHNGQPAFLLAEESETGTGKPIVLTQRDVRELQLASGAIRAGIDVLLRQAGVEPETLEAVLLAGGFGNFIRRSNAQRIGLLPGAVEHRKIRYLGNTSLAGARGVCLSRAARQLAEQLARRTEHVDLSISIDFQTAFAEAMIFPEG